MGEALIAHDKFSYASRRHHRRVEAFGGAEVDFDLDPNQPEIREYGISTLPLAGC
jgi:hypothetical protein